MLRQAQGGKETGERGQGGSPEGTASKLTCEEQRGASEVERGQWELGVGNGFLSRGKEKAWTAVWLRM